MLSHVEVLLLDHTRALRSKAAETQTCPECPGKSPGSCSQVLLANPAGMELLEFTAMLTHPAGYTPNTTEVTREFSKHRNSRENWELRRLKIGIKVILLGSRWNRGGETRPAQPSSSCSQCINHTGPCPGLVDSKDEVDLFASASVKSPEILCNSMKFMRAALWLSSRAARHRDF